MGTLAVGTRGSARPTYQSRGGGKADAGDLKSPGLTAREGSIPSPGTNKNQKRTAISPLFFGGSAEGNRLKNGAMQRSVHKPSPEGGDQDPAGHDQGRREDDALCDALDPPQEEVTDQDHPQGCQAA